MLGIGTLFAKLFGTEKALSTLVDGTVNGLDKLVYTSEEKTEDNAKAVTEARSMIVDWMRSTSGESLSRRLIALSITAVWIMQYLTMMFLSIASVWIGDIIINGEVVDVSARLLETVKVISNYADTMSSAMMLILSFYFAAPYMSNIAKGALTKFGNSNNKKV